MLGKNYNFKEAERKWGSYWEKQKVYKFNSKVKKNVYSVDTPPPTVSGRMHLGHAFSYSQQDFFVRFWRMFNRNVFYPFGTDDNGLPTERMVERLRNVKSAEMSRADFVKLCYKTINEIKDEFIQDWKDIGMSCDFGTTYSTIDPHCIKTSQKSFLDLYKKKLVYRKEAPSIWCVACQTAIAQAELEDKEMSSKFVDVEFEVDNEKKITISTTRPELLPACVCIFIHPDDKRYKDLVGRRARVPLFKQLVPIFADKSADPEKGSGILMVCSYGDKYDVEAINKKKLEPRICFTKDGRLNDLAGSYKGMEIKEAREKILEDLEEKGFLLGKKQISHVVNVHDKCGTEIEFLTSKQWFIKILDNKKKFLEAGKKIKWYPKAMRQRYEDWVKGLSLDWCVSRQRHFGVAFPVWYCNNCGKIVIASEKELPVDPLKDKPKVKCKCGGNEFIGEKDVMDTWQTSSLSPQIVLNWIKDRGYGVNMKMFPMSLRPQAHDIIRTWAFYTIVKGIYHHNKIPWEEIVISGHILDAKGRKMSKSLGNVIDPREVLSKYGADPFRFMAASCKLGEDFPFQEKDIVTGQKTIIKLWNASRFCLSHLEEFKKKKVSLELLDKWMLIKFNKVVNDCTEAFKKYEFSKAKFFVENFFWHIFCDYYLELIKDRLYNPDKRGRKARESAQYVLYNVLLGILKLFAPMTPFVTEEIYQSYFVKKEKMKSIHISNWPKVEKVDKKAEAVGDLTVKIISDVRKFKTSKGKSLKEEVNLVLNKKDKIKLKDVLEDLKAVCNADICFGDKFKIELK
jgi:valyl-tRNA synthetase